MNPRFSPPFRHFKALLPVWILSAILLGCTFANNTGTSEAAPESNPTNVHMGDKIGGISFVGPSRPVEAETFQHMKKVNANYVALLPYAFGRGGENSLVWNLEWQWWGEKEVGLRAESGYAKESGLKIMVKPQIWLHHGSYTGDYDAGSNAAWQEFEQSYENFILFYAEIAESIGAELFCIGTELKTFVRERPKFWKQLISKIKQKFSGKLTYAGNWDSYKYANFWDELDFIGVDAYFPLSEDKTPSLEALKSGWQSTFRELSDYSKKHNRPILFTEFGYCSNDFAAEKPWEHHRDSPANLAAQKNAYEALFHTFWEEEWFAGGFLWNWLAHGNAGGHQNNDFTPQNKPVENVISSWYE